MAETTHYGLYVTDNDQEKFIDWRRQMDAPQNSNMTKIDEALAAKQDNLTFEDAPTDGSNNPVKSGGVYNALALKNDEVYLSLVNGEICCTYEESEE